MRHVLKKTLKCVRYLLHYRRRDTVCLILVCTALKRAVIHVLVTQNQLQERLHTDLEVKKDIEAIFQRYAKYRKAVKPPPNQ